MEKRTMRFSLRTQFTLIIVALLAGMMLVSMLVNRSFLEDYYRTQKITALKKCRERLVEAAGRDEISSDDFDVELVKINNKDNIGIIVMNQDSMTIKCYGPDADTMQRRMWDNLLDLTPTKEELDAYAAGSDQAEGEEDPAGSTKEEAREFWRKNGMDAYDFCVLETVEDKDNYVLNVILDRKTAQQSLEMWGSLEDGSYFLLRAPLESVHNSSSLANSFFLRVGLVITAIGAVMAMILTCITAAMAGYALAKKRFVGRALLFSLIVAAMALPKQVILIPLIREMSKLHLYDTIWSVIFPTVGWPFGVFLMKQFSEGIPGEMLEAARIDGASEWKTFTTIVYPMVKPGVGALAIFTFINSWNDYFLQLIMLASNVNYTISLGIATMQAENSTDYGLIMAGATLAAIPIIIVFVIFQKYFTKGITMGAVKG